MSSPPSASLSAPVLAALARAHAVLGKRPLLTAALAAAAAALLAASGGRPLRLLSRLAFRAALAAVPASLVAAEQGRVREQVEAEVVGRKMAGEAPFTALPAAGLSDAAVRALLARYAAAEQAGGGGWRAGRVSGTVYHGGDALTALATAAFGAFALANPLHPDVFPALRVMEADVVAMTLAAFHAGPAGAGAMTSGGTESILLAVKAYRDAARARGVDEPELVAPATAHAAFDKACAYFGVKLVSVPVDAASFKADVRAMAAAVTRRTIGLVASAPCFPNGVIDDVPALAALALRHQLPLHVDACLGSFLVAFAAAGGFPPSTPFDFRVPGVVSMSVDTHKYGFAPKGSSVVLYASPEWRRWQFFVAPEWTGGIYASPTLAGSRPGALIAGAWATMLHVGADGYAAAARTIIAAARAAAAGIRAAAAAGGPLELYGEPELSVVAVGPRRGGGGGARPVNIYSVGDAMSARGWNLNKLQNPPSLHVCVTLANAARVKADFAADLAAAAVEVAAAPPGAYADGSGALYGLAAAIPDKGLVVGVAENFLNALYIARTS